MTAAPRIHEPEIKWRLGLLRHPSSRALAIARGGQSGYGGHCIWSSMFEKAALSFSAFLISSALT